MPRLAHRDIVCVANGDTKPDPGRIQDAHKLVTVTHALDSRC